ncbi:hypothetical protein HPB51_016843 [Rhipicephalus microplus]|uniref:Uncharacterized protein n=1 Tax=Rhipicephalus microplus TaxID=6941 RepID=A0A9J6DHQ6_RHIMP|nr:hypothetical protein HPB51_016843 [Rhipicephalus microplus]
MTNCSLEMVMDTQFPTWLGNSVSRHITRDQEFVRNVGKVQWINFQESLRSGHFILAVTQETRAAPPKEYRVTDWDEFRKRRKADETEYAMLEELFSRLVEDQLLATKTAQTDLQVDTMDSRFVH